MKDEWGEHGHSGRGQPPAPNIEAQEGHRFAQEDLQTEVMRAIWVEWLTRRRDPGTVRNSRLETAQECSLLRGTLCQLPPKRWGVRGMLSLAFKRQARKRN